MAKIQRTPRGLLALLGIVGENNPDQLLPDYRATIEMVDLILSEIPISEDFAIDAAAVSNSFVSVIVPQGQVWFVTGAQVLVSTVPVAVSNVTSIVAPSGQVVRQSFIVGVDLPPVATAANNHAAHFVPTLPVYATAGQEFRGRLEATDSGVVQTLILQVNFKRIRV